MRGAPPWVTKETERILETEINKKGNKVIELENKIKQLEKENKELKIEIKRLREELGSEDERQRE